MSGWDDEDDLDELLFDDDNVIDTNNVEKVTTAMISTNNEQDKTTATATLTDQINNNDDNQVNIAAAVENEEDDWEFEDEDIFNENNDDDLDFFHDDNLAPTKTAENESVAVSPPPLSATVEATHLNHSSIPPPPPPVAVTQMENNSTPYYYENSSFSEMKKNPFLQESDDEEEEEPTTQQKSEITTLPNDVNNVKLDNAIVSRDQEENGDDDGWSDDSDIFGEEEDEFLMDSSTVPNVTAPTSLVATTTAIPNAPPPPVSTSAGSTLQISPVANRTRSKTSTPSCPPSMPHQPDELTPSQQRIHQMLSTYTTNITNSDYLSHLHYKLHSYQIKPNHTSSSNTTTTTTPAAELRHYYAIRPKLRKYTLGVELTRMDYTLILENGSRTSDKDVIRSYFGVDNDGGVVGRDDEEEEEEEEATVEELLIRSANQSLLADALAALTGSEEDILVGLCGENDDFFHGDDSDGEEEEKKVMGLILSGPTLCMSSVAESCEFTVDLQCGKVEVMSDLAISVPFHGNIDTIRELLLGDGHEEELPKEIIGDGRIILARVRVSVRFRPGDEGGNDNDEPTVQYAIQSVNPLLSSNSPVLREVAIALAHDQEDPFFQDEQPANVVGDTTDIRDLFLLNQHLLSDAGLLAVSDHLERLRGAAEAKSTGFRSALRQLDGVTNVSGKFQFLKGTANAARGEGNNNSGFLGLGLTLPTAEAIEAAEREAQNAVAQDGSSFRFPRPDEVNEEHRFPRPDNASNAFSRTYNDDNTRPPPPPPPPPPPQLLPEQLSQEDEDFARPKPIIGGLFTGLSRLAAAATQPSDMQAENAWGEGGGTGLTPPSSPKAENFVQSPPNDFPALYRKAPDAKSVSQSTPELENSSPFSTSFNKLGDEVIEFQSKGDDSVVDSMPEEKVEGEDDGGWSDDEFDFDEPELGNDNSVAVEDGDNFDTMKEASSSFQLPTNAISNGAEIKEDSSHLQEDQDSEQPIGAKTVIQQRICEPSLSFSKELSMALREKVERENKEMIKSGRLKRWTPLRQDPILRKHLMEVMRENLAQN